MTPFWQLMPKACSLDAQGLFIQCPRLVHLMPKACSSNAKDWGRDNDEDEIEWIRRCLRQATRMIKPRKGKGLGR